MITIVVDEVMTVSKSAWLPTGMTNVVGRGKSGDGSAVVAFLFNAAMT